MSEGDDKDKLWYYVKSRDTEEVKTFLDKRKYSVIKQVCETEVNKIVWPREQNHRDSLSCLHYAAKKGSFEILKEIFYAQGTEKNALDINVETSILGWTPLHYAAHGGSFHTMLLLVKHGALVNSQAKDGTTPFHVAINRCMIQVIVGLVTCGANVNLADKRGYNSLHICVESLSKDLCSPVECKEVIEFLLTRGCDPSATNNNGELPLHLAIKAKVSQNIIKLLASSLKRYGGNVINTKDCMSYGAIHHCTSADQVQMLINYGANINLQSDVEESTLLHTCTKDFELVSFILKSGGDKMLTDNQGQTPLHLAVCQDCPNIEVIKELSSDYKVVIAGDNCGDTALHKVCVNNYKHFLCKNEKGVIEERTVRRNEDPIIDLLVSERGANINEKNKLGQTPLHTTVQARNLQKATILVIYGADLDVLDNKNITPRRMDPAWARRALASLEFSDLDSVYSGGTGRRPMDRQSMISNETESTVVTNGNTSKNVALPVWVEKNSNKCNSTKDVTSAKALNREMTILQNEVQDVKNFLEEFSKEGKGSSGNSKTNYSSTARSGRTETGGVNKQMSRLHDEVKDLNKMLQEVS